MSVAVKQKRKRKKIQPPVLSVESDTIIILDHESVFLNHFHYKNEAGNLMIDCKRMNPKHIIKILTRFEGMTCEILGSLDTQSLKINAGKGILKVMKEQKQVSWPRGGWKSPGVKYYDEYSFSFDVG